MSEGDGSKRGGGEYGESLREIVSCSNRSEEQDAELNRNSFRDEMPSFANGDEYYDEYFQTEELNRNFFLEEMPSAANMDEHYEEFSQATDFNRNFFLEEMPSVANMDEHHKEFFQATDINRNFFREEMPSVTNMDEHYKEFSQFKDFNRNSFLEEMTDVANLDERYKEFFQTKEINRNFFPEETPNAANEDEHCKEFFQSKDFNRSPFLEEMTSVANADERYKEFFQTKELNQNFFREQMTAATKHYKEFFQTKELNRNVFREQMTAATKLYKEFLQTKELNRNFFREETPSAANEVEHCKEFFLTKDNLDRNSPGSSVQTNKVGEVENENEIDRSDSRCKIATIKADRVKAECEEELTRAEYRHRKKNRGEEECGEELSRVEASRKTKSDFDEEEYDEEFCRDLSYSSTETAFLCAFSGVVGVLYSCGGLDWALPDGQKSDRLRVAGVDGHVEGGSDSRWLSCGFFLLMLFLGLFMAAGLRRRDGDMLKKSAVLCCLMAILHIFFVGSLVVFRAEGSYVLVFLTTASSLFLFYQSLVLWCYSVQLEAREDLFGETQDAREDRDRNVSDKVREEASPSRAAAGRKPKMV